MAESGPVRMDDTWNELEVLEDMFLDLCIHVILYVILFLMIRCSLKGVRSIGSNMMSTTVPSKKILNSRRSML